MKTVFKIRKSFCARCHLMQRHEFLGIRLVQRLELFAVNNPEDGGVRRDSNRDRQQRDDSKHRSVSQPAQPITDVKKHILHGWPSPHFAAFLFNQPNIPAQNSRNAACLASSFDSPSAMSSSVFSSRCA